jgi:hypothetical protein
MNRSATFFMRGERKIGEFLHDFKRFTAFFALIFVKRHVYTTWFEILTNAGWPGFSAG